MTSLDLHNDPMESAVADFGKLFSKRSINGTDLTTATSRSGAMTEACTYFASMNPTPNGS
jgi:hypothetical protein